MNGFLAILLILAMVATLGVLFAGLIVMARGGEVNRKYGNVLMRWRGRQATRPTAAEHA